MSGELGVAALVLCAAAMHAAWNAVVKSDADRTMALAMVLGIGAVLGAVLAPFRPALDPAAWPWLAGSTVTHLFYYACLLRAYRGGDLGRVYPIARGSAPVLVAIATASITREVELADVGGALLVSLGIGSLAFAGSGASAVRREEQARARRAVLWALGTGVTIAVYTVIDGLGARESGDPITYLAWSFTLQVPGILVLVMVAGRERAVRYVRSGRAWTRGLAGGAVAMGAWGIAIWAMTVAPIAHVAALRETSVIFAAAIGARLLNEPFGARRIAAATVVAAGVALMHLG